MGRQRTARAAGTVLTASTWTARAAFALVFAVNVQCAVGFVLWPGAYAGAYELSGVAGEAAVRGLGVAFLMWNATYPAFIAHPQRFMGMGAVVLVQQAVGLGGESLILAGLPAGHEVLAAGIGRFIAFDGAGLVLMAAAFAWLACAKRRARHAGAPGRSDDRQEKGADRGPHTL